MSRNWLAVSLLVLCSHLAAQQTLNNDAIVKMVKAGLSDDLIVTTIGSQAGSYDASTDGIIALKKAGVSDKVVSAIVQKTSGAPATPSASAPAPLDANAASPTPVAAENKPRVFLQSASKGNQWNAVRDQSMEMSKDFERDCDGVRVTINQNAADYTVVLNHIEHGFARDNQIQIANKDGDLISRTKEGGSIRGDVKKACEIILADWDKKK
ncbi:MAG: hypothetical protein WBE76_25900 [Terracidiphilus sp.]